MSEPLHLRALRWANDSQWDRPRAARAVSWAAWGEWQCRIAHSTVRCIPFCFRCMAEWPTWDAAMQDRRFARGDRLRHLGSMNG